MKEPAPKKRVRDTSKKRKSILLAALRVFREEGYEKSSMDKVAEVASASKRTLYNHFPSKEKLFLAIVDEFLNEVISLRKLQYSPSRSLEDQLNEFAEGELFFVNDPTRLGISKILTSVFLHNAKLAIQTKAKYSSDQARLIQWLRAAHKDKTLDVPNAKLAARLFYSMIQGALTWPALFRGSLAPNATVVKKEVIRVFLAGYMR